MPAHAVENTVLAAERGLTAEQVQLCSQMSAQTGPGGQSLSTADHQRPSKKHDPLQRSPWQSDCPPELLTSIFRQLSFSQKAQVELVCKDWRILLASPAVSFHPKTSLCCRSCSPSYALPSKVDPVRHLSIPSAMRQVKNSIWGSVQLHTDALALKLLRPGHDLSQAALFPLVNPWCR